MDSTIYFLSDYGLVDGFVGVVESVLHRLAPDACVVHLTHGIARFDVLAGALSLERCVPWLGPGVVLAVVDPGVGGKRRAVALETETSQGRTVLVGPDNGLLLPAAKVLGGVRLAVELSRDRLPGDFDPKPHGGDFTPTTFDGRDLFAPVSAALASGYDLEKIGLRIDPEGLLQPDLPFSQVDQGRLAAPVLWVDIFGNVQLAAGPQEIAGFPASLLAKVRGLPMIALRRVSSFSSLGEGEIGLLVDSYGKLALVANRASAAELLKVGVGDSVELIALGGAHLEAIH